VIAREPDFFEKQLVATSHDYFPVINFYRK